MVRCKACKNTGEQLLTLEHAEGHCRFWQVWTGLNEWEHETKLDDHNFAKSLGALRNYIQAMGIEDGAACMRCLNGFAPKDSSGLCKVCEREDR